MQQNPKKIIGLTGGIAAGKSTVASFLRKEGIEVIDLDQVGREIYSLYPDLPETLESALGISLKNAEGKWDKTILREAIFKSSEVKKKAEAILHPLIQKEFEKNVALSSSDIVVCEAALLIEAGYDKWLKEIIVVLAPEKLRTARIIKRDALGADLIKEILNSQVSDEVRKLKATYLIQNDGDHAHLEKQVKALVAQLRK